MLFFHTASKQIFPKVNSYNSKQTHTKPLNSCKYTFQQTNQHNFRRFSLHFSHTINVIELKTTCATQQMHSRPSRKGRFDTTAKNNTKKKNKERKRRKK